MTDFSACPDRLQLQRMILGQSSQAEAEQIERHILECETCFQTLAELGLGDTLVEAMRAVPHMSLELARYRHRVTAAIARCQAPRRVDGEPTPDGSSADMATSALSPRGEPPESEEEIGWEDYLSPAQTPDELGRLGPYRVLCLLGAGGMGVVFEAEDPRLMRRVALKAMKPLLAARASWRRRFLREAQAAAAVEHDHIVPIYDVGEDRGIPFIAMPLLRGQTLADRLNRAQGTGYTEQSQGSGDQQVKTEDRRPKTQDLNPKSKIQNPKSFRLPLDELVDIGREIAVGLDAAHRAGLIHRDIKPANIWLEAGTGRVKIVDFGLARAAAGEEDLTHAGDRLGTPCYMSPEQARGEDVDARCDLFSLGCVLYHMATGRRPFPGRNALSAMLSVTTRDPRSPRELNSDIPDDLNDLIVSLLSKDPSGRPQTAREVSASLLSIAKRLSAACKQQPEAPARPLGDESHRGGSGSRWPFALVCAAAAAALLAGVLIVIKNRQGDVVATVKTNSQADVKVDPAYTVETRPSDDGERGKGEQTDIALSPRRPPQALAESGGWPVDAPLPASAPFDKVQAKRHQQAWSDYLKLPLEYTNSIGMKFVLIPPGEFTMGSTPAEIEHALKDVGPNDQQWHESVQSEAPAHQVVLTQPFYLSVHEVTQKEYEAVIGNNPAYFAKTRQDANLAERLADIDTANHPVEEVSWHEAAEFCAKLSNQEKLKPFYFRAGENVVPLKKGTGYRLPTEAEWEFACRAGTSTRFWFGENDDELMAAGWFRDNSGPRTHEVGGLLSNPFGLFDVHGNVWEWVEDAWEPKYYERFANQRAIDPVCPFSAGRARMMRGGGWHHLPSYCRSASRYSTAPSYPDDHIGFRVALVAVVSHLDR